MGFVGKLMGNGRAAGAAGGPIASDGADGAIDTLCCVLRTLGDASFSIDDGNSPDHFRSLCEALACHVENGADVPELGIDRSPGGARRWGQLRRFYIDRRQQEKQFVGSRMDDYRGMVDELIGGLRELSQRDSETAFCVRRNLKKVNDAVATGELSEVRATLNETMQEVANSFSQQKRDYERRLGEMNERMNSLRQDLVAVREEMKRDTLTGAYNRGAFDTAITQSLNINFILNQPITLVFVDLDHFKEVNDSYGHSAGDQALRSVGDCLARSFIRKTDLVARFGGDEFAVILSDTTAVNATTLLKRFFEQIDGIALPCGDDTIRLSCSAGYTEIVAGDSVESLVKRVDAALYEAKDDGRNGYRFLPPPAPQDPF